MSIPAALQELVYEHIRRSGRMTFARFMELALYDPERGYYRASRSVVGKGGDFVTSVSSTPAFGRMLALIARYYAWETRVPEPLSIYEFGAHRGQLRQDITSAAPDLDYHTYEAVDAWPEEMNGCVIANELLDALPFHRVHVQGGRWQELYVDLTAQGSLDWVSGELSDPELLDVLAPLPVEHMEGYRTEVSLAARRWVEKLAHGLKSGVALLIDYGHETPGYFAPARFCGGLRTFLNQRRGDDPFQDIGERDITCDVNFSDVIEVGARHGLRVWEFLEQGRFLTRHLARMMLPSSQPTPASANFTLSEKDVRGLLTLTHPAHFGMAFKVLVLGRGQPPEALEPGMLEPGMLR